MSAPVPHPWTVKLDEAIELQVNLRQYLKLAWDFRPVQMVAGIDVAFIENQAVAAIVVLRYPDLAPVAGVTAKAPSEFAYIPGLLAFREAPAILAAWENLPVKPDLLIFDGQGIAHPRRMGIASHLGLWLETASIGVAKSRLYGIHAEVGAHLGDRSDLRDERDPAEIIGTALRTRQNCKPLYISPGHLIDLEQAVKFVLACCRGYRLPQPTRLAHQLAAGRPNPIWDSEK